MKKALPLFIILATLLAYAGISFATPASAALAKYIKFLVNRGTLIAKLPPATNSVSIKRAKASFNAQDVTGTPPALVSLKNLSLKNMFWQDGVIDDINGGSPSTNSCQQYPGKQVDGESAGQFACYLAQDLARSFEIALKGENTFCYLRKMISAEEGVTVSGASSVAKALAPNKDNTPKLVKVEISGMPIGGNPDIFFVISGQATNKANNNYYEHSLFFCEGGANPIRYENGKISKNFVYQVHSIDADPSHGDSTSLISSKIALVDGKLIFNPNADKEISAASSGHSCTYAELSATFKNGKIKQKSNSLCSGNQRASYSVLKYAGQTVNALRFREGAVKTQGFTNITEFREDRYVSAPQNAEFNSDLTQVDIGSDPFYASPPNIDKSILNTFDCTRTDQDATIFMDFSNQYLDEYTASCKDKSLQDMNFCRQDSDLSQAENNFHTVCP